MAADEGSGAGRPRKRSRSRPAAEPPAAASPEVVEAAAAVPGPDAASAPLAAAREANPDVGRPATMDGNAWVFNAKQLDSSVIAIPLLRAMGAAGVSAGDTFRVIIDINVEYAGGREAAKRSVRDWISALGAPNAVAERKTEASAQYVFATLTRAKIVELAAQQRSVRRAALDRAAQQAVRQAAEPATPGRAAAPAAGDARGETPSVYRIWLDQPLRALITRSVATVKVDAARVSFSALGRGVVWAVIDSGVDATHAHFARHENTCVTAPVRHRDFTRDHPDTAEGDAASSAAALTDAYGHGTHVAGIVAGEAGVPPGGAPNAAAPAGPPLVAAARERDEEGNVAFHQTPLPHAAGMAPMCSVVSLKVLDDDGNGEASNIIAAIEEVQRINGYGRKILIHGVNLSVGYPFDPEWFACGQSPLCVEVDRLVRSGVVVVAAAGNTGYGYETTVSNGPSAAGFALSINDPGNADLAITVGATHRDMPHTYGVSYFSSKGPTGDGRRKPDLVAPGEKILSCATGKKREEVGAVVPENATVYVADSGTSMAAPHVSGAVAAFLSIRQEYVGRPELVKEVFLNSATDLKRDPYLQGRGLVDLMRAIQSV